MRPEDLSHFFHRQAHSGLYRAQRLVVSLGYFGVSEPSEISQFNNLSLFRLQMAERDFQTAPLKLKAGMLYRVTVPV